MGLSILDIARMVSNSSAGESAVSVVPATGTTTRYGIAQGAATAGGTVTVLLDGSDDDHPVVLETQVAIADKERVTVVNDNGVYQVIPMESVNDALVDLYDGEIPIDPKTGYANPTEAQHSRIKNVVVKLEAIAQLFANVVTNQGVHLGFLQLGYAEGAGGGQVDMNSGAARMGCGQSSMSLTNAKAELRNGSASVELADGKMKARLMADPGGYTIAETRNANNEVTGKVYVQRNAGVVILTFDTFKTLYGPGVRYEITVDGLSRLPAGWRPSSRSKTNLVTNVPNPVMAVVDPSTGEVTLFSTSAQVGEEISGTICWFAEQ